MVAARKDLRNVAVSAENKVFCRCDMENKVSDEVCCIEGERLNKTNGFTVGSNDIKKAVVCYMSVMPVPPEEG